MKVEILTIFPEIFSGFLGSSLIKKGIERGDLHVRLTDFRSFAKPPHFKVDDTPYGGGPGMVMKVEPIVLAVEEAKTRLPKGVVILLSPSGVPFSQLKAEELSACSELIFICGRYEGVDQRAIDLVVDQEISIGDYVLMGGEVPAMAVIEATARLIPGILGNNESSANESFSAGLLESPHYTRPPEFRGLTVPEILLSGNHKEINQWREQEARTLTKRHRPDLLKG